MKKIKPFYSGFISALSLLALCTFPLYAVTPTPELIKFHAKISQNIKQNRGTFQLVQLAPPSLLRRAPAFINNLINKIVIKNAHIENPRLYNTGFSVIGDSTVLGNRVKVNFEVGLNESDTLTVALEVAFPPSATISSIITQFDPLDKMIKTGQLRLVLLAGGITDPVSKLPLQSGASFVSSVATDSPLLKPATFLLDIMQKILRQKPPQSLPFYMSLAADLARSRMLIAYPFHFSVDLEKTAKIPIPVALIEKIRTADTYLFVEPFRLLAGLSVGADLILTNHPSPLHARLIGTLAPTAVSLGGSLDGKWTPTQWLPLTLENMGLQIDWDFPTLPATLALGIPFTGLGIRGIAFLGEGKDQIQTEVAAQLSLSLGKSTSLDIGRFGIYGRINQLSLANMMSIFQQVLSRVGKTPSISFPVPSIVKITKAELRVIPKSMHIASLNKSYRAGLTLKGNLEIGKFGGGINIDIVPQQLKLIARGWLNPINTPVLRLTGGGPTGGPIVSIGATITTPPHIILSGNMEIPVLKLQQKTHVKLSPHGFDLHIKNAALFNIATTELVIRVPFSDPQKSRIEFELDASKFNSMFSGDISGILQGFMS